jgi:hypothetical protein
MKNSQEVSTMRFTKAGASFLLLAASALLLVPGMLLAQSATKGAVSGTLTDASGAVLSGTTVTLRNLDKGGSTQTVTNAQGVFLFELTDPGNYEVVIAAAGFKQFAAKIGVNNGQTSTVNVKLEVGAAGTTVEVSAAAPLLNTEAADMSTNFDRNLVENLPNGGNDLTAVAYTAPGINMNTGGGYGNFNTNGLPATSNVFTVDGENQMDPFLNLNNSGPTNLMLGKNSIEEANVVTNAYSGQYGQQAGAQVSLVSKGGTNSYHGNVQYQWNGDVLNANDWFNTAVSPNVPRPFSNNNQWAASFGGPIKKDKTFFFIDTEGIRYIVPATQTVYTPTTQYLTDITNNLALPATGASAATIATYAKAVSIWEAAPGFGAGVAFGGSGGVAGAPSPSCTDGFTGALGDTNPATLAAGCMQSYQASPALPAKEWLLIGRFDQNFGTKDRLFFRFDIDRGTQATYADPIDPPAFSAASFQPEYNNSLNWSHIFNGTTSNNFVAAISYYRAIFDENTNQATSPFPYTLLLVADAPVTRLNADNFVFPQGRNVTQWQFIDDFAKTVGRHSMKFGVNFRRYDITNYDQSEFITPLVEPGLADFFNGNATVYAQNSPLAPKEPMNTGGYGLYAQDEWSVLPRLKLTFALRAEHNFNPTCDINCFTLPTAPFSQLKLQGVDTPYNQALETGRKEAFGSIDSVNLAPRFGFIWSPRSNDKTVVSGGFGIFYDAFPAYITDAFVNLPYLVPVQLIGPAIGGPAPIHWADPAGAAATVSATANTIRNGNAALGIPSLANGLTLNQLLAAGGSPPSVTGFPTQTHTPQYQEWNFQVQQAIDSKSRITVAYVGHHGYHEGVPNALLNASTGPSAFGPGFGSAITGLPTSTPDPRFGGFTEWNSGAVSNNNEMTATYTRRMSAGFVVNANYTWAHAIDEISNGGLLNLSAQGNILGQMNPMSLRANNYGNADYDIRNQFNANWVWTEPYHFENRAANGILGGWIFSENFITRSGLPFTVTDGTTAIGNEGPGATGIVAIPTQLTSLTAQQGCSNGHSQCFNSADMLSANNLGLFPTQRRNQFRGPGFFNSDFSFGKNFHLSERMRLTVGASIYNIFNHPNFQPPNSTWVGSGCSTGEPLGGSCGQISGQAAPPTGPYGSFFNGLPAGRVGQIQGKIVF